MLERGCKPLHPCIPTLIPMMCFCGCIWKWLCPLVMPSHAPDPSHTACTHRSERENIHPSMSTSCGQWFLDSSLEPKWGPTFINSSRPVLKNSTCLPHLLRLSDSAYVQWRGRVPHYGGYCGCAFFSEELSRKDYLLWHRASCPLYSLGHLYIHSVLTHAHTDISYMKHITASWSLRFQNIRTIHVIINSSHMCLHPYLCVHMR